MSIGISESALTSAETEEGSKGIGLVGDLTGEFAPDIIKDSLQTSASRRQLTPAEIDEALKEASTTRWPIAISLVDNKDGLTVKKLAQIVGKTVSWTLKQVKAMEDEKILTVDDGSLQPKGRVYRLAVESEVLEQCKGYKAEMQSLQGKATPLHLQASATALDTDGSEIRHGFIPVSVKVCKPKASDEEEIVVIIQEGRLIVADTFEEFIDTVGFLSSMGARAGVAEDKLERTARAGSSPIRVSWPGRERLPSGMTVVH